MRVVRKLLETLFALILILWVLLPIYFISSLSLSTRKEVFSFPKPFIPREVSVDILRFFVEAHGTVRSLLNSVVVAFISILIVLVVSLPAAYALSRHRFRGRDSIMLFILTSRMLPIPLLAIPLTNLYIAMRLYDSLLGVALLHAAMALPFAIIILTGIFVKISKDFEEAAYIFGASKTKTFLKVTLPMALPGITAMLIFTFITSWNEVFAASILTVENRTLSAHVLNVMQASPIYFKYAAGFFLSLPAMVFIFLIRNYLFEMWGGLQSEK